MFARNNLQFKIGGIVAIAASGFWLPIGALISKQMARHERGFPLWSVLQAMASTIGAWIFGFPILIWYVAAFTPERDPQVTAALNEFAWLAFLTPIVAFTLQVLPVIVICFTSEVHGQYTAFPRWFGYLSIWALAVGEIPVLAIIFKSGPAAWNGLISFWCPAIGYSIWLTTFSYLLWRAIQHQTQTEPEFQRIAV